MLVSEISLVILPVASSFENCGGDFKPILFSFLTSFLGFPGGSVVKNLPASEGVTGSIPGSGRCPGEGNGNPLQYSCLGNPMDRRSLECYIQSTSLQRVEHNSATKQQQQFYMLIIPVTINSVSCHSSNTLSQQTVFQFLN